MLKYRTRCALSSEGIKNCNIVRKIYIFFYCNIKKFNTEDEEYLESLDVLEGGIIREKRKNKPKNKATKKSNKKKQIIEELESDLIRKNNENHQPQVKAFCIAVDFLK